MIKIFTHQTYKTCISMDHVYCIYGKSFCILTEFNESPQKEAEQHPLYKSNEKVMGHSKRPIQ